ncbi:hypothetical protein MSAN_02401200 [Mycena sanguinolenta]|uniref:Uncharacterized protein n=1 Tax=Mycena sanguinolenta TaxID=230812 RepID=A0A8H6X4J0_9AGAR|nr:hypothetical protein MSAN_02401200 [Mycena sanguinolenta]
MALPPPQLPNIQAMVAAFDTLSQETALLPNANAFNIGAQLAAIQASLANLTTTVTNNQTSLNNLTTTVQNLSTTVNNNHTHVTGRLDAIDDRLDAIDDRLNAIEGDLRLHPMRLMNAVAAHDKPLRGPDFAVLSNPNPSTRDKLLAFTVNECNASAVNLGLSAFHPTATVDERRRQIARFLGVAY